jgi:hypothetical protein
MTSQESLEAHFARQSFPNDYQLVNGVDMHKENGDRFQIPPDVIKKYISVDQFVELRIDSPRFSVHEDSPEKCFCESCLGEASKPILRHENPATLVDLPEQNIPSRGWGEDFWVRIAARDGQHFKGVVDNPLCESRLHSVQQTDQIIFHADHSLAIHDIHRQQLVMSMEAQDLKQLAEWLGSQQQ